MSRFGSFRCVLATCTLAVFFQNHFIASFQPQTPIRTLNRLPHDGTEYQSSSTAVTSRSSGILMAWWNSKKKNYAESASSTSTKTKPTMDTYKVLVKPRNRVSFDPDTGRYQVVDSLASSSSTSNGDIDNGAWSSLKQSFYTAVDVGKSLPSLPRRRRRRSSPPVLEDGYATLERAVLTDSSSLTPGERFLEQYQQKIAPPIGTASTKTDRTTAKPLSSFEKFKMGFYTTLDVASKIFSNKDDSDNTGSSLEPVLPVVVKSKLATSQQVRDALPDLTSENPVKKWQAVRQIRTWEEQEQQQRLDQIRERQRKTDALKQSIYQVGDAAKSAIEASVALPAIVIELTKESVDAAQTVGTWLETVPQAVEQSVKTVASIPKQVEQTVLDIQVGVETTINTTVKVVEEISALPTKFQKQVDETSKAVGEAVTSAKVLVGLEKAKPKPPKLPPPPQRTTPTVPLGWKVAGILAGSTAQVAWWAGKGVAWMTWKGAELAWEKASEQVSVASLNQERPENVMTASGPSRSLSSSTASTSTSTTTATVSKDKNLEREVQQALDLANEALRMVNEADKKTDARDKANNLFPLEAVDSVTFQRNELTSNNISKEEL